MNELQKLRKRLEWHRVNRGFQNDLMPVCSSFDLPTLPHEYQEFYVNVGIGDVGSRSDYLIFRIFPPEFCRESECSSHFGGLEFFDSSSKVDDVILLGTDVDDQMFGFDVTQPSKGVLTVWDNQWKYSNLSLASYLGCIMKEYEEYENIRPPVYLLS